jgi:hypothetical protein
LGLKSLSTQELIDQTGGSFLIIGLGIFVAGLAVTSVTAGVVGAIRCPQRTNNNKCINFPETC